MGRSCAPPPWPGPCVGCGLARSRRPRMTRWPRRSRSKIRLNGRSVVVTMRTPGHDEELALGFLHNEGILRAGADARTHVLVNPLDPAQGNIVDVRVAEGALLKLPGQRAFHASSACGVCGQASLEDMARFLLRGRVHDARPRRSAAIALPAMMLARGRPSTGPAASTRQRSSRAASSSRCARTSAATTPSTRSSAGRCANDACRSPGEPRARRGRGRAGYGGSSRRPSRAGIPLVAAVGAPFVARRAGSRSRRASRSWDSFAMEDSTSTRTPTG